MEISNIAFIGSGAATTTTLIEIFNKILKNPNPRNKLNITVVEKYPEFWKGIPYGNRSSINSLTITAVSDFILDQVERELFIDWLKTNQSEWTRYYRENGGLAAKNWLEINLPLIEKNEWQAIYLPRFVFGIYMQRKMLSLLKTVEEKQLAHLILIQAEAIDVTAKDKLYEVLLMYPDNRLATITSKKLVIGIGSAPVKNNEDISIFNDEYVYINDLYDPRLDTNLTRMANALANSSNVGERNLLIIGSNASCIELIYLLNHRPDILTKVNKIVAISQTGAMPCHISTAQLAQYPCGNLDQVKQENNYNIHSLLEAAQKDIQGAVQGLVNVPYVDRIVSYTIELMEALDENSKKIFFATYGPKLSRMIRRSGPAYKGSSDTLIKAKKLELLKGKFSNIKHNYHGGFLNYIDGNSQSQTYQTPFKIVINCSGSDNLKNSSSRLTYNLVKKEICKINLSEKGFLVNDRFEAAPNLYIMGPLLGGNVNKLIHFWHLESVARLHYLSPHLAEFLLTE